MAGETIIWAEDHEVFRSFGAGILRNAGYNVQEFSTVDAAMAHMGWRDDAPQLTCNLPDVIITDGHTNSQHNGLDLLKAAKDKGAALIMIASLANRSEVIAAGGPQAKLLHKPVLPEQLLDEVGKSLNSRGPSR